MEFGFLVQGYVPNSMRAKDPQAEHTALMEDFELCLAAEEAGFKNIWVSEHHFLDEYSHLSSSDVFLGALASRTSKAHLGSGIFNPLPKANHPAKVAERVAMLDHLTEGRFEFGTGRGAGSHEITGFHDEMIGGDVSGTKAIWEETIGEFVKMWTQDVYEGFQGKSWTMPPRRILPKPYGGSHPALWYAAGNPGSYVMAAEKGLGVLGFSLEVLEVSEKIIKSYKDAIPRAEPVGEWVNDNMIVACGFNSVCDDRDRARREFIDSDVGYHISQVFRYHDTFPRPEGLPVWPDLVPSPDEATLDGMIDTGAAIVGDPNDALEQIKRWESVGVDQFLMLRGTKTHAQTLEMIKLMGEHVIPKLDKDPVHRTTRMREAHIKGASAPASSNGHSNGSNGSSPSMAITINSTGTELTTIQEENVAKIEGAYEAAAAGDFSVMLDLWHEDITISTWTLHGGDQRILTKADALGAFGVVAKLDGVHDEVLQATPIGNDIVQTVNKIHRSYNGLSLDTEIGCMYRFKDGKIYRMAEVCPSNFEGFWDATGLDE